jgi:NMT1-like family
MDLLWQNAMAFIVQAPAATAPAATTPGEATPGAKAEDGKETLSKKNAKAAKSKTSAKAAKSVKAEEAEDSGKLDKISQLAGHRIGIVTGNEASANLLNLVLKHYGVPLDKTQISEIDPNALANAVNNNQVDVLFVAGPATGHAIGEAVAAATRNGTAPSFIEIDQADGIAKRDPAFDSTNIEAGTFGGDPPAPTDNLKTLTFPEYLVARKTSRHDRIATLARLIYSSRLSLAAAMPGEVKIEAPSTDKDSAVIVHPGALAYLNDDQKSFFDRYGDYIFYGLLIFPVFGSAIAGVASYFRRSGRTRRLRLLERLIELVRNAHAAPSLEALNQLQVDADNLVVAIIHQSEHDDYDESMQMSFSLALDQVRFAIAARRAALLDHLGTDAKPGAKAAAA